MDRRNFIKRGAVGATGFVAGTRPEGLAGAEVPKVPPLSTDEMESYLEKVDEGSSRILQWPLAERLGIAGELEPEREELARKAVFSLYMAGMFGDLPVENQLHPGMQDRMWDAAPTMDEALDGLTEFLVAQPAESLETVRSALHGRPEVAHRIITLVDEEAERSGVSEPRRAQLRAIFNDTGWRLANQPPSLIVDEYVGKVQKVTASDVKELARERWLLSRFGEEVFWQAQESARQRRISSGLRNMGIGVALFAGGLLLVNIGDTDGDISAIQWIGLIPGITGGSVLFVIGFFTLVAGLLTSDDTAEDADDDVGEGVR